MEEPPAAALSSVSPALCGLERSQAGPRAAWKSIHGRVEAAHGEVLLAGGVG